jgi:small redox-active disulfide protein 2
MTKDVKVYGPGCKRCETTVQMVKDAADRVGVEVTVSKVTDLVEIAMAGVVSTPGIAVDGTLVHTGGLPEPAALERWLAA